MSAAIGYIGVVVGVSGGAWEEANIVSAIAESTRSGVYAREETT